MVTRQISITFITGDTVEPSPSLLQRLQSPNIATTTSINTTPSHSPINDINTYLMRAANLCLDLTQDQINNNQAQIIFTLNIVKSFELAMRNRHSPQGRGVQ